jgi:hypothetical protein
LSPADALTEMLRGTELDFQFLNPKSVRIYKPVAVTAIQQVATDLSKPRAEPATLRLDALKEVIVTATRREGRVGDVPIRMEVWSAREP